MAAQKLALKKAEQSSAALIASAEEYKAATQKLIPLQEAEIKSASDKLEELRKLVADGLVARNELQISYVAPHPNVGCCGSAV